MPQKRLATFDLSALAVVATIACGAMPQHALAWGPEANRVICEIAQNHLSPVAGPKVAGLLSGENAHNLVDVVGLADITAQTNPDVAEWERTIIPADATSYDEQRDCRLGKCSVARVEQFIAILAEPRASDPERRAALNWVVRLTADANDPTMTTPSPEPGQGILVRGYGPGTSLKDLWQRALLAQVEPDGNVIARRLDAEITADDAALWSATYPEDWATEAHRIGTQILFGPKLGRIDRSSGLPYADPDRPYVDLATRSIELQLERAGIRLAAVINAALAR
jgi:hypothetical protein